MFYRCTGLISITIPSSVTNIGGEAFAECSSLTNGTIGSNVSAIGFRAFYNCTSLRAITVDNLNSFYSSTNGVLFNKSQTTLIQYPGKKVGSSYTIPNGVTSIGNDAFYNCTNLTGVTIPASITSLGSWTFYSCTSLSAITVDDLNSVYSSINGVLFNKSQTMLIQYPGRKTGSSYTITNSVTTIGDNAFYSCTMLTSVTIPASVTTIGGYAFQSCTRLARIIIPNGVTTIRACAFSECTSLTNAIINDSVTRIGNDAFAHCTNLISVTISDSITTIDDRVFLRCTSLTSITIPDNVTSIGNSAFESCARLTSITIPAGVTSIGYATFQSCSSLTSVTIPDSVTSILGSAFSACSSLTGVYFPGNAPTVGAGVFSSDNNATVYRLFGATGWPPVPDPWAGRPTALYLPSGWYTLTATNGSGSGTYTNGAQVTIAADAPAEGLIFDRWTGDTQYVNNVTYTNALVTMSTNPVRLTAIYKNLPGWYTLTVGNGAGSGTYSNGVQAPITANAPAIGKTFDQWIGDTQCVASVTSSPTTVTMPAKDIAITAMYKDIQYTLTVIGGDGSGSYTNQQRVTIAAVLPGGMAFDQWSGDTQYVDSASSASTTITMPTQDISLTATYKNIYELTVTNGNGGGSYAEGYLAAITANVPGVGKTFDQWIGDTQCVASVTSSPTTVTMPAKDVAITATYKDRQYTLTVIGGDGSGSYTNQQRATITANAPAVGKTFDRWIGDTQYVNNVTYTNALVTMPTNPVSLTATYKILSGWYTLTVNNGSSSGWYTNGAKVTITANALVGQAFARWTGATQYVASITSSPTTVTMPAQAIALTATYVVDVTKPTLKITFPTASLRILGTNGLYTVRGTAADNKALTNVMVRLNSGSWESAETTNGWKNWCLPVTLTPGTNTIRAYSMDTAGNSSQTSSVLCTYIVLGNLTIQTNGVGTVTRAPTGAPEVNKTYTLTAAAGTGSVFSNWTGAVNNPTNKVTTFTMTSNMTIRANFTDIAKPTVAITAPAALQKVFGTNGSFTVRGTAADNLALSNVMVSVNSGSFVPASTTTNVWKNWSLPVTLDPGITNIIAAYSVDATGNCSVIVTTKCVYVETVSLIITTNGPGKVTVAPTGPLLLGKIYTLTAAANSGAVFSNWIGDVSNSTNKVTAIVMTSNMTVTANFIDTAKPTVVITYPVNNSKVMTNGLVIIRGTAADNGVLSEVRYQLYDGTWTNAVSTNVFKAWTAPYVPVAGVNTSKVYSVDMQGNSSATSAVVFTYLPGAIMTVQTNVPGWGTIAPSLNGKVLQIGSTNTMTATAKVGYMFTNWTSGVGGSVVTNAKAVKFVMQSNLVLTANFRSLPTGDAVADVLEAGIVVDGSSKDWTGIPRSSFSYASTTQEVAVALDGNNIALLLNGCPFSTSDTVLVYFKLRLTYGTADDRHTVDLWTSGSVLYGMVDGQVITGLEAVLLNGVLEVKFPVEQAPSQVTIEEVGCGMNLGGGMMKELFRFAHP